MNHLSEGLLRRALDEPAALADEDRRHVGDCERCRAALAEAAADRDTVGALLTHDGEPDVDAAWRRLTAQLAATETPVDASPPSWARPRRRSLRRPAVAVAAAAALVVGGTAAAAAVDWLPIFQPQQVQAVSVDLDMRSVSGLPDLSAYGDVTLPPTSDPREVAGAAEAEAVTGTKAPVIADLPTGVEGAPTYGVIEPTKARFTFSAAKARAAAERTGQALPAMPEGVDGSTLEVRIGPGIIVSYGGGESFPNLAVVRVGAPTAAAEGVTLPVLRDYLLAQPGIPVEVARQLRDLPDDGSVLPVPVPERLATTETTSVNGVEATVVQLRDGSAAGLFWIQDGVLTAVAGTVSADELGEVARGLR